MSRSRNRRVWRAPDPTASLHSRTGQLGPRPEGPGVPPEPSRSRHRHASRTVRRVRSRSRPQAPRPADPVVAAALLPLSERCLCRARRRAELPLDRVELPLHEAPRGGPRLFAGRAGGSIRSRGCKSGPAAGPGPRGGCAGSERSGKSLPPRRQALLLASCLAPRFRSRKEAALPSGLPPGDSKDRCVVKSS